MLSVLLLSQLIGLVAKDKPRVGSVRVVCSVIVTTHWPRGQGQAPGRFSLCCLFCYCHNSLLSVLLLSQLIGLVAKDKPRVGSVRVVCSVIVTTHWPRGQGQAPGRFSQSCLFCYCHNS